MKKIKLIVATLSLGLILTNCVERHHYHQQNQNGQVTCYQTHSDTGELLFWYLLLAPNGQTYYYSSPTQITNYTSINWTQDSQGFNQSDAIQVGEIQSVESSGFSQEMQSNAFESTESQGFEGNSDNSSTDGGSFDSGSESGGFDGGGDSGGGDGGGGGE